MARILGKVGKEIEKLANARERANAKGVELAKLDLRSRRACGIYEVEIRDISQIEGGIEYYARAWKNAEPVGFGNDGSVEWERFRVINPPILVRDADGDLVEDLEAALIESLSHTLSVKKEIHGGQKIVSGKEGRTTSTFYPDADAESTSVDGNSSRQANESWATLRSAADGTSTTDASTTHEIRSDEFGASRRIGRAFLLFDTSALGDADTISSATLSIASNGALYGDTDNYSIYIVSSTPASNTAIVDADYDQVGSTVFSSMDLTSFPTTGGVYGDFSLNASGLANITKTGVSKFAARMSGDLDNVAPTGSNGPTTRSADQSGTSSDPKLVVEHTSAAGTSPISTLSLMGVG